MITLLLPPAELAAAAEEVEPGGEGGCACMPFVRGPL